MLIPTVAQFTVKWKLVHPIGWIKACHWHHRRARCNGAVLTWGVKGSEKRVNWNGYDCFAMRGKTSGEGQLTRVLNCSVLVPSGVDFRVYFKSIGDRTYMDMWLFLCVCLMSHACRVLCGSVSNLPSAASTPLSHVRFINYHQCLHLSVIPCPQLNRTTLFFTWENQSQNNNKE